MTHLIFTQHCIVCLVAPVSVCVMVLVVISVMMVVERVVGELYREGDNLSLECGSDGWEYCKWELPDLFSCDRSSSSWASWCDHDRGLRWAQGEVCGLDVVGLLGGHGGTWVATIVRGDNMDEVEMCREEVEVAEKAVVRVGHLPSEVVAGGPVVVECLSSGGHPPPSLQARVEVDGVGRELVALEEGGVGDTSRLFSYLPMVEDRSGGVTDIVCMAVQGEAVYRVVARHKVEVVFAPQPEERMVIITRQEETVQAHLVIQAFPLPQSNSVIWNIRDLNISQSLQVRIREGVQNTERSKIG